MDEGRSTAKANFVQAKWEFAKGVWRKNWFEPHSSFLTLKSFWVPFLIILTIFVFLLWRVNSDNHLVISTKWTVAEMYDWFKIPFWVLALMIPILGLFNANHKSEQARAAMELTKSQNNFANYYKHAEEFAKHCADIEKHYANGTIKILKRKLHQRLFPAAKDGDTRITGHFLDRIVVVVTASMSAIENYKMVRKQFDVASVEAQGAYGELFESLKNAIQTFGKMIVFENEELPYLIIKNEDEYHFEMTSGVVFDCNTLYNLGHILDSLCAFDPQYKSKLFELMKAFGIELETLKSKSIARESGGK